MDWMKRGYKIIITDQVHKELKNNKETEKIISPELKKGNINISTPIKDQELKKFRARYPMLGVGECSVILTALEMDKNNKKYYAILDDKNARKIANNLGIRMTGTFGLLKTLKEKQMIDELTFEQCKKDMEKSKFRINFDKIK